MVGQVVSTTDTRSVGQDSLRQDCATGEPNNNTSWLFAYRRGRFAEFILSRAKDSKPRCVPVSLSPTRIAPSVPAVYLASFARQVHSNNKRVQPTRARGGGFDQDGVCSRARRLTRRALGAFLTIGVNLSQRRPYWPSRPLSGQKWVFRVYAGWLPTNPCPGETHYEYSSSEAKTEIPESRQAAAIQPGHPSRASRQS